MSVKTSFSLSCSFEATHFPSKVLNFVFMAFLSVTWRMGTWSEFNLKIHGFFLGKPTIFSCFSDPIVFCGQKRSSPKISSDVTWTLSSCDSKGRIGKLDQLHSLNQVMSPANSALLNQWAPGKGEFVLEIHHFQASFALWNFGSGKIQQFQNDWITQLPC